MPSVASIGRDFIDLDMQSVLQSATSDHPVSHILVSVTSVDSSRSFTREVNVTTLVGSTYRIDSMILVGTNYSLRLRTRNNLGISSWSPVAFVSTWPLGTLVFVLLHSSVPLECTSVENVW